ncbi:MAG: Bug family tripartite tricarboxylate transporter substrate binding protein [Burkholderiales bacterium]
MKCCHFASLLLVCPLVAHAQSYPAKPIHLVTIFVAGSSGDFSIRVLAPSLSTSVGQPVVVENVAGAGGALATERVARAAPDGHTLLATIAGTHIIRPFLTKNISYDPVKDFTPVTQTTESITYLLAHQSVPVNSMRELIDYAKANPRKIAYGSSGIGSPTHLLGEVVKQMTGADMVHVPYKAVATALQDTISGQLQVSFAIAGGVRAAIRSGKIKVLATTGSLKDPAMPEVPTMPEVIPGYEPVPNWTGLFAPGGLSAPLLKRVHEDIVKALNVPETKKKLAEGEFYVATRTPEEFLAKIRAETALVARVVKSAGIQPE